MSEAGEEMFAGFLQSNYILLAAFRASGGPLVRTVGRPGREYL